MKSATIYHKKSLLISGGIFLVLTVLKLLMRNAFSEWYTNATYALAFGVAISDLMYLLVKKTRLLYYRWEIMYILSNFIFIIVKGGYIFFGTEHMGALYTAMVGVIAALGCAIAFMLGEKSVYFISERDKNEEKHLCIEAARGSISKAEGQKLENRAVNLRFANWFYKQKQKTDRSKNIINKDGSAGFNVYEKFGMLKDNEEFYFICLENMEVGYLIAERENDKMFIKEFDVMEDDIGRSALCNFLVKNSNMSYRIALEETGSKEPIQNVILPVVKMLTPKYKLTADGEQTLVEFTILTI